MASQPHSSDVPFIDSWDGPIEQVNAGPSSTAANVDPLVSRLYFALENQLTQNILRWSQDGSLVLITDKTGFKEGLLQDICNSSKITMTGFLKTLYGMGFSRVQASESVKLRHNVFRRGAVANLHLIQSVEEVVTEPPRVTGTAALTQAVKKMNDDLNEKIDGLRQEIQDLRNVVLEGRNLL